MGFVTVFINLEVESIYRFLFVELDYQTDVAHFRIEPTRELVKHELQSGKAFFTAI